MVILYKLSTIFQAGVQYKAVFFTFIGFTVSKIFDTNHIPISKSCT
jgi:hypothetical protein